MAGRIIQVKKIPGRGKPDGPPKTRHQIVVDTLAEFCWYYPGYTLASARKVAFRDVIQMLKKARALEAEKYRNLSQIALAPHTKGGAKKLYEHYSKIINQFQ